MNSGVNKRMAIDEAKSYFKTGMSVLFGGFGGVGTPPGLIDALLASNAQDLTLIGNDAGFPEIGIGKVIVAGRAKRLIASHIGSNPVCGDLLGRGGIEVEFSPQGILAERIRAGGVGLAGIATDIGIDNSHLSREKKRFVIEGNTLLFEPALTADIGIVYAKKADEFGNLIYDKSARNTNPLVAMAADFTVVEAEEIVPFGCLDPEEIVTPGIFVDRIVESKGVNWKWAWER